MPSVATERKVWTMCFHLCSPVSNAKADINSGGVGDTCWVSTGALSQTPHPCACALGVTQALGELKEPGLEALLRFWSFSESLLLRHS